MWYSSLVAAHQLADFFGGQAVGVFDVEIVVPIVGMDGGQNAIVDMGVVHLEYGVVHRLVNDGDS